MKCLQNPILLCFILPGVLTVSPSRHCWCDNRASVREQNSCRIIHPGGKFCNNPSKTCTFSKKITGNITRKSNPRQRICASRGMIPVDASLAVFFQQSRPVAFQQVLQLVDPVLDLFSLIGMTDAQPHRMGLDDFGH